MTPSGKASASFRKSGLKGASPQDAGEGWMHWPVWRQLSGCSGDLGEEAGVFLGWAHRGCEGLRELSGGGDEGGRKKGLLIREFTAGRQPLPAARQANRPRGG